MSISNPYLRFQQTEYQQTHIAEQLVRTETFATIGLLKVGSGAVAQVTVQLAKFGGHTVVSLPNTPITAINGTFTATSNIVIAANTTTLFLSGNNSGFLANLSGIQVGGNLYGITEYVPSYTGNVQLFVTPAPTSALVGQVVALQSGGSNVAVAELLLYAYTANGQVIGNPNIFSTTTLSNGAPISSVYNPVPTGYMPLGGNIGQGYAAIANMGVFMNVGNTLSVLQYAETPVVHPETGPRFTWRPTGNAELSGNTVLKLWNPSFSYVN